MTRSNPLRPASLAAALRPTFLDTLFIAKHTFSNEANLSYLNILSELFQKAKKFEMGPND